MLPVQRLMNWALHTSALAQHYTALQSTAMHYYAFVCPLSLSAPKHSQLFGTMVGNI